MSFYAAGGRHLMLRCDDGDIGIARYTICLTCSKDGMIPGTGESEADVRAWALAVSFPWPRVECRVLPDTTAVAGCIEPVLQSAAG